MGTLGFYFTNSSSFTMSYKMSSIYALTPRPATPVLLHRSAQLRCPERVRVASEAVRQVGSAGATDERQWREAAAVAERQRSSLSLRNKSSIILYHLVLTNPAKDPDPKLPKTGIPSV